MTPTGARKGLEHRIRRIEDTLAIQQLPIRYAMAVDARDVDGWVALFVPDVRVGRHTSGTEALREAIIPQLQLFYRSIHQIVGHRIDIIDGSRATGHVYCRAEHEVGSRWVVMAIRYDDDYQKVDDQWLFSRRREKYWYATDLLERPQAVGFNDWTPAAGMARLPHEAESWGAFWAGVNHEHLTTQPNAE
jgi:3-phenylpropionate/cinnamic acid dioxygenase small subunit